MPDETSGDNNAVSCYKEALQFSVSFVCHCLPVFNKIYGTAMNFVFFFRVTPIKIVNTVLDRTWSDALVSSVINWTYCSCTGICQIQQIRLEIWLEPDLCPDFLKMAGFQIWRSRNPVQECVGPTWSMWSHELVGLCTLKSYTQHSSIRFEASSRVTDITHHPFIMSAVCFLTTVKRNTGRFHRQNLQITVKNFVSSLKTNSCHAAYSFTLQLSVLRRFIATVV